MKDNDSFNKTQPIPRVSPDMEAQKTQVLKHGHVRELDPIQIKGNRNNQINGVNNPSGGAGHSAIPDYQRTQKCKGRKALVLFCAFVAALCVGLLVSGYMSDKNDRAADAKKQQALSQQQVQQSESQRKDLQQRKSQLAQQLMDLEAQQKKAQSEADRLQGKNEQIGKESKDKSGLEKLAEQVTGRDAQKKQDAAETDKQQKSAQAKVEELQRSIQSAKAAYEDVNEKLQEAEDMRQKAVRTKEELEKAYSENKGTVDQLLYYVDKGIQAFKLLF